MSPEEARVALEQACTSVADPTQHAHAMRFILDFRRSSTVITDSVHILQTSRIIEAVFEAAVALRLACLNDWRQQVKAHEKVELRQWLAQYLVQHSASGLTGPSIAVMSTLRELCSHAAQNREHSRTFIRVLAALVAEFNPESANCCGLTYTQHEQCRTSFEEACLRQIYEAGMLVAMTASLDHEAPTVTDALMLMNEVLSWPFTVVSSAAAKGVLEAKKRSRRQSRNAATSSDFVTIQVSAVWHTLMFSTQLQHWLVRSLASNASAAAWVADAAAAAAGTPQQATPQVQEMARGLLGEVMRETLVLLCQVERHDQKAGQEVADIGLHGFMAIVTPADKFVASVQQDDSIVRGACNIVAAMFQNVPLHAVDAAVGNEKIAEALQSLAQITVDLIRLGGASVDNCTDWQGVCTGTLLDIWTGLLNQINGEVRPAGFHAPSAAAVAAIQQCAGVVFTELLQAHLADCNKAATSEGDNDAAEEAAQPWEEEALDRLAALARASLSTSLPALHHTLASALASLPTSNPATAVAVPPAVEVALERLWVMIRVVASVAADEVHGEVPMVPADVETLCEAEDAAVADLRAIGEIIRQVSALPTGPNKSLASPRLMEATLGALARWADTYDYLSVDWKMLEGAELGAPGYPANPFPAASTPAAARQLAPQDAAAAATHTISACVACIMQYPAEVALHEIAVERVLRRVVCQRGRAALLQQVPSWRELQQEFATRPLPGAFAALNSRLHRPLAAAVCTHVADLRAAPRDTKLNMLQHLLASSCEVVVQVAAQCGGASSAGRGARQDGSVVEQLAVSLERLTGAVQGANICDNCVVYDVLVPCMEPMLVLQRAFCHHELITRILFELAAAMAREHSGEVRREGGLLGAEELSQWGVALISNFVAHLRNEHAPSAAGQAHADAHACSAAGKEEEAERAEQFESAFEVLQHLTSFISPDAPGLCDTIIQGFQALIAALPRKMLSYPSVTTACISAVRVLCEAAPEKFAKLPDDCMFPSSTPPQYVALVVGTLEWGLKHANLQVVRDAIRAIAEVAEVHRGERMNGKNGLALLSGPDGSPLAAFFIKHTLALLMRTKNPQEVMSLVATVLEPLIATDPLVFAAVMERALTHGDSEELQKEAFQKEVTQKSMALQEEAQKGYMAFSTALEDFVGATWGVLDIV